MTPMGEALISWGLLCFIAGASTGAWLAFGYMIRAQAREDRQRKELRDVIEQAAARQTIEDLCSTENHQN